MSCGNAVECGFQGHCTYESSAQKMLREQAEAAQLELLPKPERDPQRTPVVVADFVGKIDGQGVKAVMKEMKCPLELIPPQATEGIAEVLKWGAKKYAANNWMRGMSWETVMGGILRHLSAFRRGEEFDPESNLPHLDHAACGVMFLRTYAHGSSNHAHGQFDDRLHIEGL